MKILVVDGQGGGLGKAIIEGILKAGIAAEITAVGTNAIATAAILKGGAAQGATGENAVIYNSKRVDFIVGTLGIAFANSMQGEITPPRWLRQLVKVRLKNCWFHRQNAEQTSSGL